MVRQSAFIALATAIMMGAAAPASAREIVRYSGEVRPGTIVVKTSERRLYLVLSDGQAIRYPVAVGRAGKQWQGWAQVNGKHVEPAWTPPAEVRRDNPKLQNVIPAGAPNTPMGPRSLTLSGGESAIHATTCRSSIGSFASYGCIAIY